MSRKRQRTTAAAPTVKSIKQPSQQQHFRYVAAPEDDADDTKKCGQDSNTSNTNPRYIGGAYSVRGPHQREVDEVDIPAPTEWLCHDAAASARLRTDAQTDLQLYPPRRPHHLPHNARQKRWARDPAIGVAVARTLGSWKLGEDLRQERVICGGEVLPWGTWPARLRHHEGQSFYQGDSGDGGGGSRGGFSYFHASGGGVGRSGGVGGVGIVSEGSIHDELLRRQFPSSCSSSLSSLSTCHLDQEENIVTRLVPDKRGRWVEAKTRRPPLVPTATATATATAAAASGRFALPPENATATSSSAGYDASSSPPSPRSSSSTSTSSTIRLIPARYGGWVEFEESGTERANETFEQRQNRRAAVTMAARFGPDGGGDGGGDGGAVKEARGERTRGGPGEGEGGEGVRGFGTANGSSWGRSERSCEADASPGAGASVSGFGQGQSDENGEESDGGCNQPGWTVSEPAKETVRRVWNRARRRARDSFEPRHRAPPGATDGDGVEYNAAAAADDASGVPPAVHGAATRDQLDPGLLSSLGRECEGIIDAALHVVLADRVRRVQSAPRAVPSSTQEKREGVPSPPLPPPPPPLPHDTADWQDVLRAMRKCSEGARGSRTPTTDSAAPAAAAAGGAAGSSLNAAAVYPAEERTSEGRGGSAGGGVSGHGVMEKEVWGRGSSSDGSVVVVNERLPGLPLNEAVLTRTYNRLLLYLHEKKEWQA